MPVGNPAPRAVQLDGLKLMWLRLGVSTIKRFCLRMSVRVGAAGGRLLRLEPAQPGTRDHEPLLPGPRLWAPMPEAVLRGAPAQRFPGPGGGGALLRDRRRQARPAGGGAGRC